MITLAEMRKSGIEVLVATPFWDALFAGGRRALRPRATIAHELGHVVLHVSAIRKRKASAFGELALKRVSRGVIKAFQDPEWQAWAFAGCLLAPRRTIMMLDQISPAVLARVYGMSEAMAGSHLKRLKLVGS